MQASVIERPTLTPPIVADAMRLASAAASIVGGRKSTARLYTILAGCLSICERCNSPVEEKRIRDWHASLPRKLGQNRQYIEAGSDIFQVVARAVFHGDEHTANINRYAIAMRLAAEREISSSAFVEWLQKNGGVNALYLRRPLARTTVRTKCLRLLEQIEVPKSGAFSITIERTPENAYRVISGPEVMQ